MIHINPDPHKGGYVYLPQGAVTAFFPAGRDIAGALRDLSAGRFDAERIDVFTGPPGEAQLDLEGRRHGLVVRFMRSLQEVFTDEAELFRRAEHCLQNGGRIVAVYTHEDEALKKKAADILKAHGGEEVVYWGRWTLSSL